MEITKEVKAGRVGKADLEITLTPAQGNALDVRLESSVERLFGNHIRSYISDYLQRLDITSCKITAIDDGALDFVIKARLEAALYKIDEKLLERFSFEKKKRPTSNGNFRRTRLYIPGNNPYLMEGCGLFGADVIILDLEDAVSQNEKIDARLVVRNALSNLDFGNAEAIVRINPFTNNGEDDVYTVMPALPDAIMFPKTENAADILKLDKLLEKIEQKRGIDVGETKIYPLIETAEGVLNAHHIAKASRRNVMLTFGAEDFTANIGVKKTVEGKELFLARSQIVLAATAAGIQASDTVFSDFEDVEGLMRDTELSKSIGFSGRGVIHPLQIEHIHKVFRPTEEEVVYATKVVAALEEAEKSGSGVASLGRKMIDAPVAKRARKILELSNLYKEKSN
jgi:citrate lyase subunit beta/citryl-CoA lyase